MNKHLHRIVFNAARGLRMVVQETAKSTGRGARKAASGGAGASSAAVSVAAIAAALMSAPLHAQIVADPGAPGRQRPTVLVAPNGVPLVNIQTPSAAGVSRNTYSRFDVQRNGVILNNSRGNVQTQLGGWVQGNPWLAGGRARVILNEVHSANPSQLRGYVEVAGPRTEVIIANPAGIQVDGGGFINASRATLTTGTPQFNAQGGLDSFVVRGGSVSIDGAGLDASKTDYAAILARAVQVNAGLWANELKVVTGANQVSADSSQATPTTGNGAAPSFALDVAALGGMYAGKITLVGTEAGVGVRNAGHIGAGAGGLAVTAAGRLENTGTLEGAKVELSSAADIDNRGGTIRQAGTRDISVTAPVLSNTNGGVIGAEPVATADPASGTPGTDTGATGTNTGATPTTGTTAGTATSTAGITEVAPLQPAAATGPGAIVAAGSVLNDGGRIYAGGEIALNTPRIDNTGGALSVGTMAVTGDRFSNAGGTLNVSRDFTANVGSFDNSGGTLQAGRVTIDTTGELSNRGGSLVSQGDMALHAGGQVDNGAGTLSAGGSLVLSTGGALSNGGGVIVAGVDIGIQAGRLANTGVGTVRAGNDLNLAVAGTLLNEGSITAGRHAVLSAADMNSSAAAVLGAGIQSNGTAAGIGDLKVTTAGGLVAQGTNLAAGDVVLQGASVNLGGSHTSGANLAIAADQGDVVTSGATVVTPGTLTVAARVRAGQVLLNDGGTLSAGRVLLDASHIQNTNAGQIGATADASIRADGLNNDGGTLTAVGNLSAVISGAATNVGGTMAADGDTTLGAQSFDNTGGTAASVHGDLRVTTAAATVNTAGALQAENAVVLENAGLHGAGGKVTGRSVAIETHGQAFDNAGGTVIAATTLDVRSGALTNDTGLLQSGGAMSIDTHGGALSNRNAAGYSSTLATTPGGIASGGALTLAAGVVDNSAGFLGASGDIDARLQGLVNADGGLVLGQSKLTVDAGAGTYDNRGGQTLAIGDLTLTGTAIDNTSGLVRSGARTTLNAATVANRTTAGTDQGVEGVEVAITANQFDNSGGAVRADGNVTVTSSGSVLNTAGLLSAGDTLRIADANSSAKQLVVVNGSGGMLVGNESVAVDAAALNGNGVLTSGKNLAIALTGDVVNDAQISANGNLSYGTTGTLTNSGKLAAGQVLTVSGTDIVNTATGEMAGDTTIVNASGTLTNRGLIDGGETQVNAGTLTNIGTGRIYGDHLSISAGTLNNLAETIDGVTKAGTIAARSRLDIGAQTINNRDGALIFSAGDLYVGGALDGERKATGMAGSVNNRAATIEAIGNVTIGAAVLNNTNGGVTYTTVAGPSEHVVEYAVPGSGERVPASDVVFTLGWRYSTPWDTVGSVRADDPSVETRSSYKIFVPPAEYPLAKYAAYYAMTPSNSVDYSYESCSGGGDSTTCGPAVKPGAWYASSDPIWADFGVTPPAELSATHPGRVLGVISVGVDGYDVAVGDGTFAHVLFDHPVTQSEVNEWSAYLQAHNALDAATSKFIEAFLGTFGPLPDMTGPGLSSTWDYWDYTKTSSTPVLQSSAPGRILSGGAMTLSVGSGTNDMSQILAGGALTVRGGTITNHNESVNADVTESGTTVHSYVKTGGMFGSSSRAHQTTPYNITVSTTVQLAAARQEGNQAVAGTGAQPGTLTVGQASGTAQGSGQVTAGNRVNPIIQVASEVAGGKTTAGNTGSTQMVVRTSAPNASIPSASLFNTTGTGHYLIETDPRFANQRKWLSSDYLLNNLGLDPNNILKRLGDGFYEQQLIRQQVAQLTGYRYLEGFNSDEAQYNALMNAGVTFAEQYHLTPGIALSAAQMAQLTSDIVWLVEQTVTLPDGSTQRVLAPQVYVRVKPGDIDGSGALLSGSSVNLNLTGDLSNQGGTIAGRTTVALTADNIHNLGGRITGKDVALVAGTDLNNIGGVIDAQHSLAVMAGRNVNVITTTSDASSRATTAGGSIAQQRTVIDRVAGLYVSDPGGSLEVYAGGNIHTAGAQITSAGSVGMTAKGDVTLDSVTTGQSESIRWSSRNSRIDGNSSETGTTVSGGTSVAISAGGDLTARAATLSAGTDLSLDAGGKLVLYAGQDQTYAQTEQSQRSGMSYRRLEASSSDTTLARTTLEAQNVKLRSGGDTTLGAIKVDANTLDIQAGGQLNLLTQTTTSSRSRNESDGNAMFVNARTKGNIDETTNYNQFNVASVHLQAAGGINANVAKGTDLATLAQQPGMAWVNQLISDPALVNSTQWRTVEEAHQKWQTDQSGLGPVSSALVMLVVAVATAGAGTAAAGTAGTTATATSAATVGTGMAGAMGLTAGQTAILAGAMQAGITTLAGQATVSFMNNAGNLGKVFDELVSSQSLQNLATAMVTAGVLQGLSTSGLLPENLASATNGTATWTDQLQRQLIDNTAAAVIRSGINGTSLQGELQQGILTAFLNTAAAQGANWIGQNGPQGNQSLNAFAAEAAHAIVGCAVGAGRSGSGAGCAPGALGAVIGHLTAQAVNPTGDPALANETLQASQLMAGLAGAFVSANGQGVSTAASAGVNAAENNWLSQKRPSLLGLSDQERYAAASAACGKGDEAACGTMRQLAQVSAGKDSALRDACATGANSPGCVAQMQIAQAAGNNVFVHGNGNITINGVSFATAGPVTSPFTTSTAGQMAQSTADGLILEVGNQIVGAAVGALTSSVLGRAVAPGAEAGGNGGVGAVAVDAGSVKGVNPTGSTQNCTNCVAVVDNLLTTGNPASALPRPTPVPFDQLGQMYGTKLSGWTSQQNIESTLLAQGNGARAVIYGTDGATGHVWNAVVQNGKVNYIDGQIGGSGASNFKAFTNFQFGILP
ncbi:filamentous hemagglutinin N-terminal domain-containing protein [Variovorax sp. ZT4R33]|uniref:two-partner secretion domain-containing protein n=1 Tax=Variovorax sp. ZT4R33 TaxID=3443743 RepID=UPI003F44DEE8